MVTVRIFNKKEPRDALPTGAEIHNVSRGGIGFCGSGMNFFKIIHDDSKMAVAIAQIIRRITALIDSKLKLKCRCWKGQVDEREALKVQPVDYFQAKGIVIELD